MSPAPHRPERAPPHGRRSTLLSGDSAILPPDRHASRSFLLAASRLRALHPDPLLTAGDQPLPRRGTNEPRPRLTAAPVFIERLHSAWMRPARSARPWPATMRTVIHLVPVTSDLLDAAIVDDDALARALGHDVTPGWVTFREALQATQDAIAAAPAVSAWGARFFVAGEPLELVGWGGFKGPPEEGVVEIGYEIAEGRRGRGLATAAARAMVAEAFADEQVMTVMAHTLPERNPSNRVLEKVGFRHDGEDREGGERVWRYVLARPLAPNERLRH
jgi:ribosomal-protein-alanine N-acetyltransferase